MLQDNFLKDNIILSGKAKEYATELRTILCEHATSANAVETYILTRSRASTKCAKLADVNVSFVSFEINLISLVLDLAHWLLEVRKILHRAVCLLSSNEGFRNDLQGFTRYYSAFQKL